ncbi:MAG: VapC toxin family PIN domain ribonuclease [Rhizobium sp. 63-7]|nr:MAG: VapC toxin family PIN domain ribonuclease [Rhizobium sp. 63-7]
MVKALFDTNILIDYLSGREEARTELSLYKDKAISIITWMEVLIGAQPQIEKRTRAFLEGFDLIVLDNDVAERSIAIRREQRLKLPDAIILASAEVHSLLLVTRNTKDFPATSPNVRIPYHL